MKFEQLKSIVENGGKIESVKITDKFPLYYEENADPNMVCDIIGISHSPGEAYILKLDFDRYRKYNESVAKRDWFDKNRVVFKTWFETIFYPKDGIVDIYVDYWRKTKEENEENANNVIGECFDFSDNTNQFIKEFTSIKRDESYIEWLESELKKSRS